ncbi:hypothetical protein Tco_0394742 [Tanacetum coccineum]
MRNKGETIHEYHVRFTKLINDIRNIKMTMPKIQLNSKFMNNMLPEWGRFVTAVKLNRGLKTSNYDQLYVNLKQHKAHANKNKMMLERINQHAIDPLALISNVSPQQTSSNAKNQAIVQNDKDVVQNVQGRQNKADQCDAFDSDVDEAPTTQTMFMANLSSADPIYDEAGPSYDSDILTEVHDHDNYLDNVGEHHEVHEMQNDYVKDNAEQVVQSNVSSVPNDALMMIINNMHEQAAQCMSANEQNKVVNVSLTAKLARYKELVGELHSVKMQLNSTIDHNKLMKEEVATLKKDFKQKENKYLEDFLDMKALKEKVEDKLFKQDQSLQTVHMLCKPKPYYDEKKKVSIGYKNPLYLTSAMQVQSALYNGHEIVKTNHAPAVVHDSEDTLELAEITRKKMLEKMKMPLWIEEVKEIKEIFEQMEVEVDQNAVDKKSKEIERKNLLIEHENLIAACLSNELLYSVMNSVNTVSRFFEMHDAYTVEQTRCLELKAEISKLKHKIKKDDHNEMLKHFSKLEESMGTLREIVEEARIEKPLDNALEYAYLYTKQSQELLEYVIGTCLKELSKRDKKWKPTRRKFTLGEQCPLTRFTKFKVVPLQQPKHVSTIVQIVLWYLDSGCSKHMTGNRSWLRNFVKKFIGTVRFGNNHFGAIMGYRDYVIGDSVISRVYYVEGLGHNLFSVGQFCD